MGRDDTVVMGAQEVNAAWRERLQDTERRLDDERRANFMGECVYWFALAAMAILLFAVASCVTAEAAPAPLAKKARESKEHPAWIVGRWDMTWGCRGSDWEVSYETDFRADGSYRAAHTGGGCVYVGTYECRGMRLIVRERPRGCGDDVPYSTYSLPLDGGMAGVCDAGDFTGVRITLKPPAVTD